MAKIQNSEYVLLYVYTSHALYEVKCYSSLVIRNKHIIKFAYDV